MSNRILCVDDEPAILQAFQRNFRKKFEIEVAESGDDALALLREGGEQFAVIVSDLKMPGMDGIEFLKRARSISPESVRMMLTGNADMNVAIEAVNQGNVFQFLTKPCSMDLMATALENAVKQYHLVIAEQELLEETLQGSVQILIDILSRLDPDSFGFGQKVRQYMEPLLHTLGIRQTWDFEIAALLSHIGYVTIPASVRDKVAARTGLSGDEQDMVARAPQFGHDLLANIPRLDSVAEIILYQNKQFDGGGFPTKGYKGSQIPLGARILCVLSELVRGEERGKSKFKVLEGLKNETGIYDPDIIEAALKTFELDAESLPYEDRPHKKIGLAELRIGDLVLSDVVTEDKGVTILAKGTVITQMPLALLKNFARINGIQEPIMVALDEEQESKAKYEGDWGIDE